MERILRSQLVGRDVIDAEGASIGTVADTWPQDGGGLPEMVLVKMGRFSRRKFLPLGQFEDDGMHLPFTKLQIDDGPDAEDNRWGDPGMVARAHWRLVGD